MGGEEGSFLPCFMLAWFPFLLLSLREITFWHCRDRQREHWYSSVCHCAAVVHFIAAVYGWVGYMGRAGDEIMGVEAETITAKAAKSVRLFFIVDPAEPLQNKKNQIAFCNY